MTTHGTEVEIGRFTIETFIYPNASECDITFDGEHNRKITVDKAKELVAALTEFINIKESE